MPVTWFKSFPAEEIGCGFRREVQLRVDNALQVGRNIDSIGKTVGQLDLMKIQVTMANSVPTRPRHMGVVRYNDA